MLVPDADKMLSPETRASDIEAPSPVVVLAWSEHAAALFENEVKVYEQSEYGVCRDRIGFCCVCLFWFMIF